MFYCGKIQAFIISLLFLQASNTVRMVDVPILKSIDGLGWKRVIVLCDKEAEKTVPSLIKKASEKGTSISVRKLETTNSSKSLREDFNKYTTNIHFLLNNQKSISLSSLMLKHHFLFSTHQDQQEDQKAFFILVAVT